MTWFQKSGNKYHAVSSVYNGYYYQSKKEAAYAQELDLRKKAGDIKDWERQVKISLDIKARGEQKLYHICNYYVDFLIHHNNKSKELIEVKGFETDVWRLKRKLLEAVWLPKHKDYIYTVVK